jgi:hypothetical protein
MGSRSFNNLESDPLHKEMDKKINNLERAENELNLLDMQSTISMFYKRLTVTASNCSMNTRTMVA